MGECSRGAAVLALLTTIGACSSLPESAPGRTPATRCTLEAGIREEAPHGGAGGAIQRCEISRGVCDPACAERTRACVHEAIGQQRPLVAIWTGNYRDGLGKRFAVVSEGTGPKSRLVWLEYTFGHGLDSAGAAQGRHQQRVLARECSALLDLRQECGPNGARRLCNGDTASRREALWLGCLVERERQICEESW